MPIVMPELREPELQQVRAADVESSEVDREGDRQVEPAVGLTVELHLRVADERRERWPHEQLVRNRAGHPREVGAAEDRDPVVDLLDVVGRADRVGRRRSRERSGSVG